MPPHLIYRLQKLFQALGRKVLCLYGDNHAVRSGESVDGQHPERGHTVDEHIVVLALHAIQVLLEYLFSVHGVDEGYFHTG